MKVMVNRGSCELLRVSVDWSDLAAGEGSKLKHLYKKLLLDSLTIDFRRFTDFWVLSCCLLLISPLLHHCLHAFLFVAFVVFCCCCCLHCFVCFSNI